VAEVIHSGIRGSQMVIFQESSHMALWEERKKFIDAVYNVILSIR
jgi:proline iminopeptidase